MARLFTNEQKELLRAPSLTLRICFTFYLDEGTYRFCDDIADATDGVNTYLGANPLASSIEIRSGRDLAAEPITIVLDGNKMTQAGINDPASVLRDILGYLHRQRRVDVHFGLSYPDSQEMNLLIPVGAMKINYARLIDKEIDLEDGTTQVDAQLEIVMDSLAARYGRATFRTRSHDDQLEIDPTDQFFSFVSDAANNEKNLLWGKKSSIGYTGAAYGPTSGPNNSGGGLWYRMLGG